jgi:hypothetical protein
MVVNKLQNGLLNSRKTPSTSRLNCQFFFFKCEYKLFLNNSDRDFYSEDNNVSQV